MADPVEFQSVGIPREDYERHKERKDALGLTWAEYLDGQAPDVVQALAEAIEDAGGDGLAYEAVREAAREGAREALEDH